MSGTSFGESDVDANDVDVDTVVETEDGNDNGGAVFSTFLFLSKLVDIPFPSSMSCFEGSGIDPTWLSPPLLPPLSLPAPAIAPPLLQPIFPAPAPRAGKP